MTKQFSERPSEVEGFSDYYIDGAFVGSGSSGMPSEYDWSFIRDASGTSKETLCKLLARDRRVMTRMKELGLFSYTIGQMFLKEWVT